MNTLPAASPLGSSTYWAAKGAQLAATAGASMFAQGVVRGFTEPSLHALEAFAWVTGVPAVVGGVFGFVAPRALDRLRGRVPVWGVAAAQPVVGAIGGLAIVGLDLAQRMWRFGVVGDAAFFLGFGAIIGAVTVGMWWLPFTMATVLGRRWPVTTVAGVAGPFLVFGLLELWVRS